MSRTRAIERGESHTAAPALMQPMRTVLAGYGRYEHLFTLGIAGMLLTAGSAMTVSSCSLLLAAVRSALSSSAVAVRAAGVSLDLAALGVALASVTSKELLFHVTHAVGKRTNSPSLVANACESPPPIL